MVAIYILALALLSGATAFSEEEVQVIPNTTSTIELYPWTVQVDFLNIWGWVGWTQNCAGTLITSRHILSSASCFSGPTYPSPHSRRVRAGAEFRLTGGVITYVEGEIKYNWNDTLPYTHDITVVRLTSNLQFGRFIGQGAIVAPNTTIPNGIALRQLGWGLDNGTIPLSSATVTTYSVASNQTIPSNVTNRLLLASASLSARFNGDIGGPWIIGNVTVGVLSGANIAVNGSWSDLLYATAVSAYTDWIVRVAV